MRITMNRAGFIFLAIISTLLFATCQFGGCDKNTSEASPSGHICKKEMTV